jgi:hypothetical protein
MLPSKDRAARQTRAHRSGKILVSNLCLTHQATASSALSQVPTRRNRQRVISVVISGRPPCPSAGGVCSESRKGGFALPRVKPRSPAPRLEVEILGGRTWRLADQQGWTMIEFYRGLHCPGCQA